MAAPLIDRALLERLERLTLQWQQSFHGLVGGHNLSRFPGSGQEFLDHRSFHYGDDFRSVNWRAYMRFEKLFLKIFQTEPHVPLRVLLDCSSSMAIPGGANEPTKFEYACKLAAAFVYVGLVRLDNILLQPFTSRLHDPLMAGGGRHRFLPAESFLRELRSAGVTDFYAVSRDFLNRYRQPGLVIVVSDFLSEEDCFRPLQYLADFGHELLLLQIWNEGERLPKESGEVELLDAEIGTRLTINVDDQARLDYIDAFDRHSQQLQTLAQRNGGRYAGLCTRESVEDAIFGTLGGKTARALSVSSRQRRSL